MATNPGKKILLLAVGAGLSGVLAYALYGAFRTVPSAAVAHMDAADGSVVAESGTINETQPPARVIPDTLPEFSLATLEGPPRSLSSFDHPSLVVNFWATWCAPCRREIPLLRQMRRERAEQGVEVVGIAVDFRDDVVKYAREIGLDYPLLIGEQDGMDAANAFGMDLLLPFTVFADRQRRIVAVKVGELHAEEASFILDQVARLNAGQIPLEQAKRLIGAELERLESLRKAGEKPA